MKKLVLFLTFLICQLSFATEQTKDSLVYEGKGYYIQNKFLFENIMTEFIEENGFNLEYPITHLWRGYKAIFEVKENQIYLKDLISYVFNEKDSLYYFHSVITEEIKNKIHSQNLNTVLIVSDTDENWEEKSFEDADYWVLEIIHSKISKKIKFKFNELEKFKENQFQKFKKTPNYKDELEKCQTTKTENIKKYSNPNLPNIDEEYRLELLRKEKQYNCSNSIKVKMFSLYPSFDFYHKIL